MVEDFREQVAGNWELPDVSGEYVNEQNLFDSFIIEANDIYGLIVDYYSLVFDEDEADVMYGEDQNEYFKGPYRTKMSFRPGEENDLVNMFGLVGGEMFQEIYIPMYTFTRDCSAADPPKPGDVVYFHYTQKYFEITNANDELDIFQSKKMSWMFEMKPYRMTNVETSAAIDPLTEAFPLSAFGDNDFVETAANEVDNLEDLPNFEDIYGIGDE